VQSTRITRISPLELAMREVCESLGDFTAGFGLEPGASHTFTILSIEPASEPLPHRAAQIVPYPAPRLRAAR
jgi:hypothetical protein